MISPQCKKEPLDAKKNHAGLKNAHHDHTRSKMVINIEQREYEKRER